MQHLNTKTKEQKNTPTQVVIKKYPNRRLYDTEISAYITLDDLCARVKQEQEFVVLDAKTGQDLTRQVLAQIIYEQETKGQQLLPISLLRNSIRFYDDKMQTVLERYLEASMSTFMDNQERMRGLVGTAINPLTGTKEGASPLDQFGEITRQNVAFFERTMQMFNPFGAMFTAKEEEEVAAAASEKKRAKR